VAIGAECAATTSSRTKGQSQTLADFIQWGRRLRPDPYGTSIIDPYRRREAARAPEVNSWLEEQNHDNEKVVGSFQERPDVLRSLKPIGYPRRRGE